MTNRTLFVLWLIGWALIVIAALALITAIFAWLLIP
jgi:hypothetical protein